MSRPLIPAPSKLLPRLIETIEVLSLSSDGTPSAAAPLLSVDAIVENLRGRFAEYKRKPLTAFRATVERLCREQKAAAPLKRPDEVSTDNADVNTANDGDDSDVEVVRYKDVRAETSDNRANDAVRALYAVKQKTIGDASASSSVALTARNKRKAVDTHSATRRKRIPIESPSLSASEWHPTQSTSTVRYSDIGGIDGILADIRELIEYPMAHPELYSHLGVMPPRGVLLNGPPGCGKCFGVDTPIIMFDGDVKCVQDIVDDDVLMGE